MMNAYSFGFLLGAEQFNKRGRSKVDDDEAVAATFPGDFAIVLGENQTAPIEMTGALTQILLGGVTTLIKL